MPRKTPWWYSSNSVQIANDCYHELVALEPAQPLSRGHPLLLVHPSKLTTDSEAAFTLFLPWKFSKSDIFFPMDDAHWLTRLALIFDIHLGMPAYCQRCALSLSLFLSPLSFSPPIDCSRCAAPLASEARKTRWPPGDVLYKGILSSELVF